jgi:DNA-binding CsgD family transcriptional regulator
VTAPALTARRSGDDVDALQAVHVGWLAGGVRDLMATDTVDDVQGRRLYDALGDVPVRAVAAVTDGRVCGLDAGDVAGVAGVLQGLLRRHVRETGSTRFARVQEVLEAVSLDAGPNELSAACPAALCDAGGFDRALVSRVEGSSWTPGVLHVRGAGPVLVRAGQVVLVSGLPETDVVRRRQPQLVLPQPDGWTDHPLTGAGVRRAYVTAPLVADGRVIGLLHADNQPSGRPLTKLDRDVLQLFADGFTRAYERAALLERVVRQREQIRQTLLSQRSPGPGLDPAAVRFSRACPGSAAAAPRPVATAVEVQDDRQLTAREHEILSLLATGATNLEIADRLVVSESTVKSHVKRILRKLPAANRAEAVYVFLRMTGAQDRSV